MGKGDSQSIYKWVLDDVVTNVQQEFLAHNVNEYVLEELRERWQQKLSEQGLLGGDEDGQPGGSDTPAAQAAGPSRNDVAQDALGADLGEAGPSGVALGKRKYPDSAVPAGYQDVKVQSQPEEQVGYAPIYGLIPQHDGPADAGEPAEADDKDLSEDQYEDDEEEEEVENLLIGQFDKVNKMKNRWKVTMKDCVFHINGKDHLFRKCTGEFHWQ